MSAHELGTTGAGSARAGRAVPLTMMAAPARTAATRDFREAGRVPEADCSPAGWSRGIRVPKLEDTARGRRRGRHRTARVQPDVGEPSTEEARRCRAPLVTNGW